MNKHKIRDQKIAEAKNKGTEWKEMLSNIFLDAWGENEVNMRDEVREPEEVHAWITSINAGELREHISKVHPQEVELFDKLSSLTNYQKYQVALVLSRIYENLPENQIGGAR